MEHTRKIVLFPTDQFFAIAGNLTLPQDPYLISLPDIFNEQSNATHRARDHVHRSGRIFLDEVELYAFHGPGTRVCSTMERIHVQVGDVRAAIDFHPERYRGNDEKRREHAERHILSEALQFVLHRQVFVGTVDPMEVYRKSEGFVSVTEVQGPGGPIAAFLDRIGCPQPEFMAVNLGRIFHS